MDFIIDGKSLLEIFPRIEFMPAEDRKNPQEAEEIGNLLRLIKASRLGNGSSEWQVRAIDQLLLRAPPELSDGRRRLYVCGGDCECEHIACVIENRDGLFIWRDFVLGSPVNNQAEAFRDNAWQRIDFVPNPHPNSSPLTAGPFHFEEVAYKSVFEPLYAKVAAQQARLKEVADASKPQKSPEQPKQASGWTAVNASGHHWRAH